VDALTAWLRSREEVLAAWSVADYVKEMNAAAEGGGEGQYRIPDTLEAAEQFLLLYGLSAEGNSEIKSLVSTDRKWLRLVCRVRDVGAGPYLELAREAEQKGRELFGQDDRRFEVRVTGESFLLHRAMARILTDVATSNITAFIFIFGSMFIAFRSWKLGLLSIIPNVLPIFSTLAFMGLTGIPLRVGTIVVFSIGLGIAVDDTIHYFLRFRKVRAECGSYEAATTRTFLEVGRPMIITTILLVAGFLSFVPAEFLSIRQMGILNAFTLLVAVLSDLTLTPIMLRLAPAPPAAPAAPGAPVPAAGIGKEVAQP
jgi:predicted RND superfamily exporter protein